jgi:ribose transport system substrate-binding protein
VDKGRKRSLVKALDTHILWRRFRMRKLVLFLLLLLLLVPAGLFAGSGEGKGEAEKAGFNIAVSNGLITHSWRTQMVKNLQQAVAWYQGRGYIDKFYLQHAGFDVDLQIQHVRNFMNMGVDAIIIDPLSATALNPVLEEAQDEGILVMCSDEPSTSTKIMQFMPTHDIWMERLSRYVFERMGGKGNVVYLSGIDGAPASDDRDSGFERALADYPDIKLLTKAYGSWDPSLAQQAMADVIAAYPNIDGVVAQDGECLSVIRAFEAAGLEPPIVNGSGFKPFFEYWTEHLDEGFTSYAIANGPGFSMTGALGVVVGLLQGKELKPEVLDGKVIHVDHRYEITDDNVEEALAEHIRLRGVEDYIDEVWTYDQVMSTFFK